MSRRVAAEVRLGELETYYWDLTERVCGMLPEAHRATWYTRRAQAVAATIGRSLEGAVFARERHLLVATWEAEPAEVPEDPQAVVVELRRLAATGAYAVEAARSATRARIDGLEAKASRVAAAAARVGDPEARELLLELLEQVRGQAQHLRTGLQIGQTPVALREEVERRIARIARVG